MGKYSIVLLLRPRLIRYQWASISPAAAEHKVLSFIPYLQAAAPTQSQTGHIAATAAEPDTSAKDVLTHSTSHTAETSSSDPYGPRKWHSSLVKLSGKNRALNEFSIERVGERVDNNLVMLHGYGAGLGFFYKNFEPLSRIPHWRLYALDLLGMGRSSRPNFRIHAKDHAGKIAEAESWFCDALEEWRIEKKIDRFTLLGHSLGGYMAVAYALKYPGHLNKLILASPVGIPEDPYAVNADMPEPGDSIMAAEIAQDQSSTTSNTKTPNNTPQRRPYPKWLTYLWDANISPFSLVRWAGPLGPRLVSGWTSRRFSQLPSEEAQALHDYAYTLFRQRGSGEYALAYILAPGAFARSPLIRRIGAVGWGQYTASSLASTSAAAPAVPTAPAGPSAATSKQGSTTSLPQQLRERGVPVVFLYGEHDWMDVAGGFAAQEELRKTQEEAWRTLSSEEAKRDQGDTKVLVVKGAGHHVYLDGWREFNEMMRGEMGDVEVRERDRREG